MGLHAQIADCRLPAFLILPLYLSAVMAYVAVLLRIIGHIVPVAYLGGTFLRAAAAHNPPV